MISAIPQSRQYDRSRSIISDRHLKKGHFIWKVRSKEQDPTGMRVDIDNTKERFLDGH